MSGGQLFQYQASTCTFIIVQANKGQLKTKACHLMDLAEDSVSMWVCLKSAGHINLDLIVDKTLTMNVPLADNQVILLKEKVCAVPFSQMMPLTTNVQMMFQHRQYAIHVATLLTCR